MSVTTRRTASLAARLDIRPGEERGVLLLLGYSFASGVANVFIEVGATTLFLTTYSAARLPFVYIAAAGVMVLVGATYTRLARRVAAGPLLGGIVGLLCLGTLTLTAGLRLPGVPWVIFALMVWNWVVDTLGGTVFSALSGQIFNLEQGKRLFGLVGAGEMAARVISLFLIPLVVPVIGAAAMIPLAGIALGIGLIALLPITRHFAALRRAPGPPHTRAAAPAAPGSGGGRPYVGAILAVVMLATILTFFISYGFSAIGRARYANPADLARFLALVLAVMNIGRLVARLFLTRPLLNRYGLQFGLLALPVIITALMAGIVGVGWGLGTLAVVFWLMTATRVAEGVARHGLQRPAWQLLYQPLPSEQRLRASALVEGIGQPVAIALAGAALLGLNALGRLATLDLAAASLPLGLVLIAMAVASYRGYRASLSHALSKRWLGGQDLVLDDASTIAAIEDRLASPHQAEVLYALDLLERAGGRRLGAHLIALLGHADPLIRREVAGRIARLGLVEDASALRERLAAEDDPAVLAAVIGALATIGHADPAALAAIHSVLADGRPELQVEAGVGLLRAPGSPAATEATALLDRLAASPVPEERALAARALGRLDASLAGEPLAVLLSDPEPAVRRASLLAAGQVRAPRLWPAVIAALDEPGTARVAARVLTAGGVAALPAMMTAAATAAAPLRAALLRIAGRLGPDAVPFLRAHLDDPDDNARTQALRGLARQGYRSSGAEADRARRLLRDEIAAAAAVIQAQVDLAPLNGADESVALLGRALIRAVRGHRVRACLLLALLHDAATLLRAEASLGDLSADRRAFALEVLNVTVAPELRRLVLPLFDALAPAQRLQRLAPAFPQRALAPPDRLAALLGPEVPTDDPWLRVCALAAAPHGGAPVVPGVIAAFDDPQPLVREAALRALARLDRLEYARRVDRLATDADARVRRAIHAIEAEQAGELPMLSTIEKVIILKAVGLFARVDEATLADLALLLEEETVPAGTTVIEQGDHGTSMYIIVDGELRVHADGHALNDLGARDFFGEMALLDPEPRVASVTALTDCRLLRLDQEPFYELLEDHIDVARGIIQVLSQRLRARVRDLNAARIAGTPEPPVPALANAR